MNAVTQRWLVEGITWAGGYHHLSVLTFECIFEKDEQTAGKVGACLRLSG